MSRWTECGITHPVLHWQNNSAFPEVGSMCLTAVYYEGANIANVIVVVGLSHVSGKCQNPTEPNLT